MCPDVYSAAASQARRSRSRTRIAGAAAGIAGALIFMAWQPPQRLCASLELVSALCVVWFAASLGRPRGRQTAAILTLAALPILSLQIVSTTGWWVELATLGLLSYAFAGFRRLRDRRGRIVPVLFTSVWLTYLLDAVFNRGAWGTFHLHTLAVAALVLGVGVSLPDDQARVIRLIRQLRNARRSQRQLLRNIGLPVLQCNAEGRVTGANAACSEKLDYTVNELTGRSFESLLSRSALERIKAWSTDHDLLSRGLELEMLTKAGGTSRVIWWRFPLCSSRIPGGFVLIGEDVTGRQQLLEQNAKALEQLQQMKQQMETDGVSLDEEMRPPVTSTRIIGQSDAIQYVLRKIAQVAPTDATVLIEGETGVGKELVARALHEASARARGPFIPVNCAALPPTLVESELFGHERGAFTGADRQRKGRFEAAEGGTIFLDEVGELSLEMQVKLLRVLQESEYERVGSSYARRANVRVIAATNRNLQREIAGGRFREDLFYRLQVYPISIPALRERREDIPLLVSHFVRQLTAKYGKKIDNIPGRVMTRLQEREWPGNVRELMNAVERAVIMTSSAALALPPEFATSVDSYLNLHTAGGLMSMANAERDHILRVLEHTGGRIAGHGGAAEVLEMHPNTLRARMDKLGILKREDRRSLTLGNADRHAGPLRNPAGLRAI